MSLFRRHKSDDAYCEDNIINTFEVEDDDDDGERISVYDAALIWASNGKDEDYTFGYTEEELEDAF